MRLTRSGYAALLAMMAALPAYAADTPVAPAPKQPASGFVMPEPYTSLPDESTLGEPMNPGEPVTPGLSNNMIVATLNDGSRVVFEPGGVVMVLAKDGSKTPAPDGMLTLKDGTPFVVKDGKRVSDY